MTMNEAAMALEYTRLSREAEASRREVEELRGQVAKVNGHVFQRDAEIARLRAENERNHDLVIKAGAQVIAEAVEAGRLRSLLKGALVPCPECGGSTHQDNGDGTTSACECVYNVCPGYVPAPVEP